MPGLTLADTPRLGCRAEDAVAPVKTVVPPDEFFAFKQSKDLLRARLAKPLLCLFKKLTGLPLHVLWHDVLDFHDPDRRPVLCPVARRKIATRVSLPPSCATCLRQRWRAERPAAGQGRPFNGRCGATCAWMGLQVGSARPLTLVLRSGDTAAHFDQAALLLRWVLHDLQSTLEASHTRQELESARQRNKTLEAEAVRVRQELLRRAPSIPENHAQAPRGSHRQQIVQLMLDYLHTHYHRPMHLGDVAAALKMNESYLCSLFSATLGVSFHHYLEELRLARAKELLRNPAMHVCEVGAAAGYANAGQFGRAFKVHTGLSPRVWREGGGEPLLAPRGTERGGSGRVAP